MLSPPFQNVQDMNEFDSETNSDDIEAPQVIRSYTVQQESLPSNFVPVIKPKKSCKTIISLNLLNCLDIIEHKRYFSEGEINQNRYQHHKHKIALKRKEHSMVNDAFVNKTYDKFMTDNFRTNNFPLFSKSTKGKRQSSSSQDNQSKKGNLKLCRICHCSENKCCR